MNPMQALLQREWLQYRRSWLLLIVIPLALATLLLTFGHVEFDADEGPPPAAVAAVVAVLAGGALMLLLFLAAGLITVIGLPRRDHADRSVEFWLSLPVSHPRALAVPMAVHLLVMPLVGAAIGVLAGFGFAGVLVSRAFGAGELDSIPWGALVQGAAVGVTRLTLGWPMALLWLSPIVLVTMLAFAWARRWGLFALAAAVAVCDSSIGAWLGLGWLSAVLGELFGGALSSLVSSGRVAIGKSEPDAARALLDGLERAPHWLWPDVLGSLQQLATPSAAAAVLVAAVAFAALVQWRRRGASVAL